MIVARTIQGTGTHFLYDLFQKSGVDADVHHWNDKEDFGVSPVVATIRNPKKVYKTWKHNGYPLEVFEEMWSIFNQAYLNGNVTILPIDTINRDEHLSNLSLVVGQALSTDWTPLNASKSDTKNNPDEDKVKTDINFDYINDLPIVQNYYGI